MSNIVPFTFKNAEKYRRTNTIDEIFCGLGRGEWGFVLAGPYMGKTNLAVSLCIEASIGKNIIGLLPASPQQRKVLFVPYEEGMANIYERFYSVSSDLPVHDRETFESNFSLYSDFEPLLSKGTQYTSPNSSFSKLTEEAKGFDLIIIDTARSAMGDMDEVLDDPTFKMMIKKLASETTAAVLILHHLTKNQTRSRGDEVNPTGGSGLSSTQSESKYHLYLKMNKDTLTLIHTKATYAKERDKLKDSSPLKLQYTRSGMLVSDRLDLSTPSVPTKQAKNSNVSILLTPEQSHSRKRKDVNVEKLISTSDLEFNEELLNDIKANQPKKTEDIWDEMFSDSGGKTK